MELSDVEQGDVDVIARSLGLWQCTERWALGGQTPSPEVWGQLFYQDVPMQYVVRADDKSCAALLQLTSVRADDGFAHLEMFIDPAYAGKIDDAVADFVDRAFDGFPLRKLIVAAAEDDLELPSYVASAVRPIGQLSNHRRRGRDHYVAVNLYELWVDDWTDARGA